jgi:hypothetical protein
MSPREETDVPGPAGEDELRILLARDTPRLPAPEGRMAGVRERAARTRRRRRAALALGCGAGALAVAAALLPGVFRTAESPAGPAAPAAPASPGAPERPTRDWSYDRLGGLVLRLPGRWHTQVVRLPTPDLLDARGYAALRPFPAPRDGSVTVDCVPGNRTHCLFSRPLGFTDVLLTLDTVSDPGVAAEADDAGPVLRKSSRVTPDCAAILGTASYTALIGGSPEPATVVRAEVCLARDAPAEALAELRRALAGARFADTPGSAGPRTGGDALTDAEGAWAVPEVQGIPGDDPEDTAPPRP